jgi:hypothetical protein
MFDEVTKYKHQGHFFLTKDASLKEVCNAPIDKSGVYIVYALKNHRVEMVYIGRSGKKMEDGSIKTRKVGLGGLKDRLVNGHHFGKVPRRISWPNQMYLENIEALDVYWYVTYDDDYKDCPTVIERLLINRYKEVYGELPPWNKI